MIRLRRAGTATAALVLIVVTACTGGSDDGVGTDPAGATSTTEETTTTTAAPILYGLVPNLALAPEQCWADIATTTTSTTSTTAPPTTVAEDASTTTTEDTVPETLPPTVTSVPQAPTIGVVDCAGSHDGQAFASFCLAAETDEDGAPTGELTSGPCDGITELEWPGDRTVRRAAARICLEHFALAFDEPYEESPLTAREFTPTEGIWERGERRVVCTVDADASVS